MAILKGIISKLNGSAGNLTFKQLGGPEAEACSNCASRVPGADNRTEILSPANEQYTIALRAVPFALRAFQMPEAVPNSSRWFQLRFARSRSRRPTNKFCCG